MNSIFDKLKTDFEYITGSKYIGLVRALGAGYASRLSEFLGKLSWIEKQAFIETADADYLYLHGACLLEPKGSEVAEGYVVFYGDEGKEVPIGTVLSGREVEYITTSKEVVKRFEISGQASVVEGVAYMPKNAELTSCVGLVNGVPKNITANDDAISFDAEGVSNGQAVNIVVKKTAPVSVKCVEAGAKGNVAYGEEVKTKVTIEGIDRYAGSIGILGGKDEEGVEEYRKRLKFFMANPQAPFNENNIRSVLLEMMPTLKRVWVKSSELEDGIAKVFAINHNNDLTEQESDRIVGLVQGIKPIHVKSENILAGKPIIKTANVVIRGLHPSHEKMKNQIRKNIEFLFSTDMFERGMTIDEIESMVYRTEFNGERVERFEVVSGSCSKEKHTLWLLGSVTFV